MRKTIGRAFAHALLVPALALTTASAGGAERELGSPSNADFVPYAPPQEALSSGTPYALTTAPMSTAPAAPKNQLRPISEVVIDTSLPGGGAMPTDGANDRHATADVGPEWIDTRPWMTYEFAWAASGLAHRPSYLEDLNLERYGNSACPVFQPVISGARFFASVPLIPYQMVVHRPRECIYMLGYCRPGSPAPNLGYRPPLRLDAAAVEAAAITGAVFIIP